MKIRVGILHSSPITAAGLKAIVEGLGGGIEVAWSKNTARELVPADFQTLELLITSDVIDYESARHIRRGFGNLNGFPKCLLLTNCRSLTPEEILELFTEGFSGIVHSDIDVERLKRAIPYLLEGQFYFDPLLGERKIQALASALKFTTPRLPGRATTTSRETEVLRMLADGLSVKQIANRLNLSHKTVEAHKFNIMRKLDVHNKAQLVRYAVERGLIHTPQTLLSEAV